MTDTELLVGAKAIARFLGITPRQAEWHMQQGRIPSFRLGHSVAVRKATLIEWLREQEQSSPEASAQKQARG